MTVWRMSFRVGNQGHEMWPDCFRLGVAAITYPALVETDLSKLPKGEPKELWAQLAPAQKYNLRQVAYEMKAGDVVYVLQDPNIVGKGSVQGPYRFDAEFRLIAPDGVPWAHRIPVNWAADFPETRILLGVEQFAVRELSPDKLEQLQTEVDITIESNERREAFEGETYRTEAAFRRRNRALIQAKKANSDYLCEGCGFSIEETYGSIGREYIIAHHLSPIASGPSTTTLDKIALVCANCHAMVHTQSPPISIEDLRKLL